MLPTMAPDCCSSWFKCERTASRWASCCPISSWAKLHRKAYLQKIIKKNVFGRIFRPPNCPNSRQALSFTGLERQPRRLLKWVAAQGLFLHFCYDLRAGATRNHCHKWRFLVGKSSWNGISLEKHHHKQDNSIHILFSLKVDHLLYFPPTAPPLPTLWFDGRVAWHKWPANENHWTKANTSFKHSNAGIQMLSNEDKKHQKQSHKTKQNGSGRYQICGFSLKPDSETSCFCYFCFNIYGRSTSQPLPGALPGRHLDPGSADGHWPLRGFRDIPQNMVLYGTLM